MQHLGGLRHGRQHGQRRLRRLFVQADVAMGYLGGTVTARMVCVCGAGAGGFSASSLVVLALLLVPVLLVGLVGVTRAAGGAVGSTRCTFASHTVSSVEEAAVAASYKAWFNRSNVFRLAVALPARI